MMRVAIFHNRYFERGGEDVAADAEAALLAKAGHEVHRFTVDNREAITGSRLGPVKTALGAHWNPDTPPQVDAFLDAHPVDVAHVHNFFPVLSPSLHWALARRSVPVVQTLHNYRLLCANGMFLRDGKPCEECVSRGPWNALRHGCYRGSRAQTAVWARATAHHRRRRTWESAVSLFTTPSEFARRKLLQAGLAEERVVTKPNPVPDPGPPAPMGEGAVFVGRLSHEKGVDLLLEAWRAMAGAPLAIVGAGPEESRLRAQADDIAGVRFLGAQEHAHALAAIAAAAFVVVPSRWYEVFPMAALEALACGRALVVPRETALAEIVEPGRTGLHFAFGDAADLARACRELLHALPFTRALGEEARGLYEDVYADGPALGRLEAVYERALRESA
ncbi:MAG TPA: glycosyltransferase [Myxococcota bacterium]|nr:glycosyltransferase [Myxococcota bacterium]